MLCLRSFLLQVNLNFFQNEYDVKLDILECTWYNQSYYKHFNVGLVWYNRTQRAINGSFQLLVNQSNKVFMSVQLYKMMSNEYRFFPVTFQANTCAEYNRNSFSIRDMLSRSSNLNACHVQKVTHLFYLNLTLII
ncbi:hypothetical protein ILUMI_22351 [Ignelater luminosus]|uniref:Uncharacterized protein n=1 Tax=Ignelater luminosus TaxID=2038154 RepID=A0A8K0CAA9_IGNLU|nr:hypothetical protein ILUMI_22351 [Ignelater luminosus]